MSDEVSLKGLVLKSVYSFLKARAQAARASTYLYLKILRF